jgi:hypothetical protein
MLDESQRETLFAKIQLYGSVEFEDKDRDALTQILHTEPMLKALGRIYSYANSLPTELVTADLTNDVERNKAIRLQGQIQGYVNCIANLLQLATLPEEIEYDD